MLMKRGKQIMLLATGTKKAYSLTVSAKSPLVSPRPRFEDDIKTEITRIYCEDVSRIQLAQI
jgi:hypothetical protein